MLQEVFMGDETREILRKGTSDYTRGQSGSQAGVNTPELTRDFISGPRRLPLSPQDHAPPSPLSRDIEPPEPRGSTPSHQKPTSQKTSLSNNLHYLETVTAKSSPMVAANKQRHRARSASLPNDRESKLARRVEEAANNASKRAISLASLPPKKQRTNLDARCLPALDLDLDIDLDLSLGEIPLSSDDLIETASTQGERSSVLRIADRGKLASTADASDIKALNAKVIDLKSQLISREDEVRSLKAELIEKESQHFFAVKKIRDDLHREYSQQASEKFRSIIKKLQATTQKKVEEEWQERITALEEIVEAERREKAELVQACDEYLRLKGF